MSRRRSRVGAVALLTLLLTVMTGVVVGYEPMPASADGLSQETPSPTPTWPIGTFQPPSEPPVTEVPSYASLADPPDDHDVMNILVLGSDTSNPTNNGRTDAIMIVSINRTAGTANLLSIPRDLFVYVPGWTMQRINTAFGYGQRGGYEGGGYGLLEDTILYNLGIRIDYYVRVNFGEFQQIIDALGGIEITVDCTLQDWRLTSPDLDPAIEDNWELFTLPVGVHQMDGALALWYARSRRTSSDFDRGRRQQDIMRAIWQRLVNLGLLNQLPDLWGQLTEVVDTDMQVQDILGLVPLALSIDSSHIAFYTFRPNEHVRSWQTPAGSSVQLPDPEAVHELIHNFMQPPTENRLVQSGQTIEVLNTSGNVGLDRVAADRLAREGFIAIAIGDEAGQYAQNTVVYDYTGRTKGNSLDVILTVLRLTPDDVIVEPDPDRNVDYRVVLGGSYRSCTHGVLPPVPTPTPPPVEAAEGDAAES